MKKFGLLFILLAIVSCTSVAQSPDTFFKNADAFFKANVSNGKVDYMAIKENPKALKDLMIQANNLKVSVGNEKEYQAFWINAYNLSVIKGIIDNYPTNSPLDNKGFFDKTKYDLGGTSITLNDIENKMLRAKFNEPRFHFVLVCGAKGCPPIISEAYKPDTLEKLLQQQTEKSLNNAAFIKVSDGKAELSEIFKWYKDDFTKNGQTEIEFLNKFRKSKIPADAKIGYYSYDWRLNSK